MTESLPESLQETKGKAFAEMLPKKLDYVTERLGKNKYILGESVSVSKGCQKLHIKTVLVVLYPFVDFIHFYIHLYPYVTSLEKREAYGGLVVSKFGI